MEYTNFIYEIIKNCGYKTYLELGVSTGTNIGAIAPLCDMAIGVDIIDIRVVKNFRFKQMTTDSFFKTFSSTVDVVFIDADHNYEAAKRDFLNAKKILNKHGLIILHDTDPSDRDFFRPKLCGDSYRLVNWIKVNTTMDVLTLPFSVTGLTLVRRNADRRIFAITDPLIDKFI